MPRTEGAAPRRAPLAAGFTAVEMIVVVSIVIMLVAMTVPSIFPAIKKGRVHDAANAIMRACHAARTMARNHQQPAGAGAPCYGVAIVVPVQGPAYATVIYGTLAPTTLGGASPPRTTLDAYGGGGGELYGDGLTPATAKPVARYEFNRNVLPFTAITVNGAGSSSPYTVTMLQPGTSVGWFYQYRTGFVIESPASSGPHGYTTTLDVGSLPLSPPAGAAAPATVTGLGHLGVCTLDARYVAAVAIYRIGLGNLQDL